MGDTLGSVTYPFEIANALPPNWSLITCSLTSAGLAWGVKSLQSDVRDLDVIVKGVKERRGGKGGKGKVVIMGHSTGCQDCMEFVVGKGWEERESVDGIILQAPVSDREALAHVLPEAFKKEADELALRMCREGKGADGIPNRFTKSIFKELLISAKRWVDVSTPGGADDYFSSDLPLSTLQNTFGKIPWIAALCILYSGAEESVPESLDKEALVKRWVEVVKEGGGVVEGHLVPGATHNLEGCSEEVRRGLVERVCAFVRVVEGREGEGGEGKGGDVKGGAVL